MNKFVILATYRDLIEAEIVKGRLESEGIQCVLADDVMVSVNPLYSNAIGGIKLKVWPEDYDRAVAIIGLRQEVSADADDVLLKQTEAPLQSGGSVGIFVVGILIGAALLYLVYIKLLKAM